MMCLAYKFQILSQIPNSHAMGYFSITGEKALQNSKHIILPYAISIPLFNRKKSRLTCTFTPHMTLDCIIKSKYIINIRYTVVPFANSIRIINKNPHTKTTSQSYKAPAPSNILIFQNKYEQETTKGGMARLRSCKSNFISWNVVNSNTFYKSKCKMVPTNIHKHKLIT